MTAQEPAGGGSPRAGTPRSRGIDYLGNLGRMLRDLTGFATLMFELLQNADDAGATSMRIDVGQDALVVFNDAVFSDCGDQDLPPEDCLYLEPRGHRCDLHSFRDVASGDKRGRADTTGAFGIGFTAVYQVADAVTLISAGRRWDIDEIQPETSRIIETPAPDARGTTFILPWARDPESEFRRRTGSAAVGPDDPQRLLDVLANDLPTAMLFLRHVREVEVARDEQVFFRYRREDADDICEITGGDQPNLWLMLRGDFDQDATALRGKYPGKIEDRRRPEVTIAIPLDSDAGGLLCAYLPTDERSGLPAHVNADFYPESDRKHLITDSFHGEWNRLAVRAAARILASQLPSLAPRLGHERLWRLIFAAHEAKPAGPDTGLAAYWEEVGPLLPELAVMWTTTGQWVMPASTVFLYSSEEDEVIPVLEDLGILVMHPEVGAYARRMSGRAGARQLSASILAETLLDSGLTETTSLGDAPTAIATPRSRELLWRELERLLGRATPQEREAVQRVAIMPGADGRLWPAGLLQRADTRTTLLIDLGLGVAFLDQAALPEGCTQLAGLCPVLGLRSVLTLLARQEGAARLAAALDEGRVTAAAFLSWLRRDEQAILTDALLRAQVRELPVYPAAGKHRPLAEVVLPGGFTDRLGIAEAIDGEQVSEHITFLRHLGATPLTLRTYLTEAVPRAAQRPEMLSDPRWKELIADMAARLDTFAQDAEVRQALTPLALVPCRDGTVLPASSCYFASETVTAVLGPHASTALPLAGHERSTASLYEWLGVAAEPRLPDVVARVKRLAAGRQDPQARQAVAAVIRHLGKLVPDRRTPPLEALFPLRELAWLPARGDHAWHRPAELNTVFREVLFATQGRFLDLPLKVQQDAADFLHWLGVETNPSVSQVVDHLITRARQQAPVSRDVYLELNRNAEDPAVGRLASEACLLLSDGEYVRPGAVFRQANPFGRFRRLLGPDFDAIGSLLDRLDVKRLPDHDDARDVLIDISGEEDRRFHVPVDDVDDLAVIWRCWRMLDEALSNGEIDPAWFAPLRNLAVIPNDAGVLTPPTRLLVDDMPGVAAALNIGDAVIRRKEGMWRAFQAAGVRSLTEAVIIEILHMRETTRDGAVRARMQDRRPALARILDEDPDGIERLTAALRELSFPESPALRVRYHLPDFQLSSAETSLNALYVPADLLENRTAQLISCPADGAWPWMLIAKEFARALYPGETPGPLASSLYVALSPFSLDAAHSALDDAGWPHLEHVDIAPSATTSGAGFMDYNPGEDEPGRGRPGGTGDATTDARVPVPPGTRAPTADGTGPSGEKAGHSSSGAEGEPRPGLDELGQHPSGQPGQPPGRTPAASESADRVRHRVPHGRLRSYVATGSDKSDAPGDGERPGQAPADTSPVDQAGVRRVVDHERAAGRHPEVMPHENPGFDVLSRDGTGRVLRHIEVKSVSGAWDDMGVGLTRTQFEFARQHRDTFWLYVVEYAVDDQRARVLRIADPAGRAEEFRFDDGWSAASEDAESDPADAACAAKGDAPTAH
jgi:Domain of unknown function (DUF3883)